MKFTGYRSTWGRLSYEPAINPPKLIKHKYKHDDTHSDHMKCLIAVVLPTRGVANGGAGGQTAPPRHQKSGRREKYREGKKGKGKKKEGKKRRGRKKGRNEFCLKVITKLHEISIKLPKSSSF